MKTIGFLCKVCTFFFFLVSAENILISLHIVTRHGDREPIYQIDKFKKKSTFYRGLLVEKGKERMLNAGRNLRKNYENYLPSDYDSSAFYFQSTNYKRTSESLHHVLRGLFPKFDQTRNLSEIPVNRTPKHNDTELLSYYSCAEARKVVDDNFISGKQYLDTCKANKGIRKKFLKNIGEKGDCQMAMMLVDSFEALVNLGLPLRDADISEEEFRVLRDFKENNFKNLRTFNHTTCSRMIGEFATKVLFDHPKNVEKFLKSLPSGVDVRDALNYFVPTSSSASSSNSSSDSTLSSDSSAPHASAEYYPSMPPRPPFYYHYSAHDATLVDIAGCFGVDAPGSFPRFGSVFVIETYVDVGENSTYERPAEPSFSVRIRYDFDPRLVGPLNLTERIPPHCRGESPCPLKTFRSNYTQVAEDIAAGRFRKDYCTPVSAWRYRFIILRKGVAFATQKYPSSRCFCGVACLSLLC